MSDCANKGSLFSLIDLVCASVCVFVCVGEEICFRFWKVSLGKHKGRLFSRTTHKIMRKAVSLLQCRFPAIIQARQTLTNVTIQLCNVQLDFFLSKEQ